MNRSSRPVGSRRPARFVALLATVLVLSACGGDLPRGAAATVDGVEISRDQLATWVRAATTDNPELDEVDVQRDLLSRWVQAQIVAGVVVERGVTVTEEDLEFVRAQILEEVGGPDALAVTLAEIGFPLDFYESVFITNQAAIDAIARDLAQGRVLETRTARHILLETAEEADEVFALLEDGADFEELAIQRSKDPGSAVSGGSLGARERGMFVPEFDEAVWTARLNVVLAPVESQFGFHVIEVVDSERRTVEQLGSGEVRMLVEAEFSQIISAAIETAVVFVATNLGTWDPVNGTIVTAAALGMGRG